MKRLVTFGVGAFLLVAVAGFVLAQQTPGQGPMGPGGPGMMQQTRGMMQQMAGMMQQMSQMMGESSKE